MALLVWFTMGIALWHFTVFLPDHFWQGIVGAFLGSVIGAVVFGAIVEIASGRGLGDTDLATALTAIPGVAIGLAVVWAIGVRSEQQPIGSRCPCILRPGGGGIRPRPLPSLGVRGARLAQGLPGRALLLRGGAGALARSSG